MIADWLPLVRHVERVRARRWSESSIGERISMTGGRGLPDVRRRTDETASLGIRRERLCDRTFPRAG